MDSNNAPAIVIAAFNRPASIQRLLTSINNAHYPVPEINLVISIDYQSSEQHAEVVRIAEAYPWEHGLKTVIAHDKNLGLRNHILSCGDLSQKYGAVIVLEDDLVISPYFYDYAIKSVAFYRNDIRIGGISLYNHKVNFCVKLPFELLAEPSDVYFLQIASSWGQIWTNAQWTLFRDWYAKKPTVSAGDKIPDYVIQWPETSWLKFYIKYLAETDRYFVYPKHSYSTNFGDVGTHHFEVDTTFQVPLMLDSLAEPRFVPLEKSINVYDSHFEILPDVLKKLNSALSDYNFVVDMYGIKNLSIFAEQYAISSKKLKVGTSVKSFGLSLKPMIMNVVYDHSGEIFHLSEKVNFGDTQQGHAVSPGFWNYFYKPSGINQLKILFNEKIKEKLFKLTGSR